MYYRKNGKPIKEENVEPRTKMRTQPLETQPLETQPLETQPLETQPLRTTEEEKKGTSFPVWLLLIIIAIILAIGLGLLFMLRRKNTGQTFGFRFY